jgi:lipopolysaccharide/colanic/teichoic acid biosynthesis glycosyltransferase
MLSEPMFLRSLTIERKRAERSNRSFLLVVVECESLFQQSKSAIAAVCNALCSSIRETDSIGWQRKNAAIGIILTEIGDADKAGVRRVVAETIRNGLRRELKAEDAAMLHLSLYFFPEEQGGTKSGWPADGRLYPDLEWRAKSKRVPRLVKRAIDIVGSLAALLLFSPLYAVIAAAIKLTSRGPVLFRQIRVGQYGHTFQFLKFRSMRVDSDPRIHQQFINEFIKTSSNQTVSGQNKSQVYKITDDPRVTRVGRILRKTSLDEIPQFWNVLVGEMSLVGPRPPIPYELESYRPWHKRRILEVKPGLTGLWQIYGRSRTTFDEMVRLDLRYARTWTLLLDLKILLQTPRAMVSGEGAY